MLQQQQQLGQDRDAEKNSNEEQSNQEAMRNMYTSNAVKLTE